MILKRFARSINQRQQSAQLDDAIGKTIDLANKRIEIGQAGGTDTDQCKRTVGCRGRIQFIETGGIGGQPYTVFSTARHSRRTSEAHARGQGSAPCGPPLRCKANHSGTSTAAPWIIPLRNAASAALACTSG